MATPDISKVVTGKEARLYITLKGKSYLFAEAVQFTAALNPVNQDVQFLGDPLIGAVFSGYTVTLSVKEYVVRDDLIIKPLLDAISKGESISWDFQGVLDRTKIDKKESRQTFRNCIPDGTINLLSVTPGEVVQRETSFRGNARPELVKALTI